MFDFELAIMRLSLFSDIIIYFLFMIIYHQSDYYDNTLYIKKVAE